MAYVYDMDAAFPKVAVEFEPVVNKLLVQLRQPRKQTKGGVLLVPDTQSGVQQSTIVAKILAIGPYAFEGTGKGREWSPDRDKRPKVGDFVVVRKWAGDQFMVDPVDTSDESDRVLVAIIPDIDVVGCNVVDPVNAQLHGVSVSM